MIKVIAFERATATELSRDLESFFKNENLSADQIIDTQFTHGGKAYGEKLAFIVIYRADVVQQVDFVKEAESSSFELVSDTPFPKQEPPLSADDFIEAVTVPSVDREALQLECKRLVKESSQNKEKLFNLLAKFKVKKFTDLADLQIDAFAEECRKLGANI